MKLYDVHCLVLSELVNHPQTRNSDSDLYISICERLNPGITEQYPFGYVLRNRKDLGLPNFETVGRCRRKIQENHALLRPDPNVVDRKYNKWKEFREYAQEE